MKVEKVIYTTVEKELEAVEVSLLSKAEWEQAKDIIPNSWAKYWMSDPAETEGKAVCFIPGAKMENGTFEEIDVATKENVRPVLRFSSTDFEPGDSFIYAKIRWTVIAKGAALANAAVGKAAFTNIETWLNGWKTRVGFES